jgi:hypothetical protein
MKLPAALWDFEVLDGLVRSERAVRREEPPLQAQCSRFDRLCIS